MKETGRFVFVAGANPPILAEWPISMPPDTKNSRYTLFRLSFQRDPSLNRNPIKMAGNVVSGHFIASLCVYQIITRSSSGMNIAPSVMPNAS